MPENMPSLRQYVRAQLYVDSVPGIANQSDADSLVRKNRSFQESVLGDVSLPTLAVLTPDGKVLAVYRGTQGKPGDYSQFLKMGLQRWLEETRTTASVR